MAESRISTPSVFQFDGGNFQVWKFQMKSVLVANRLFDMVNGHRPRPKQDDTEKWIQDDARATTILTCAMVPRQVENCLICESAKEIWDKMTLIYEQKSAQNKGTMLQKFYNLRMEASEPVVQYTTKIMNMARTLKDLGESISEAAIVAKILGGLSSKFSNFVTAWDSVDEARQTLDFLQERLIKEENKLQGSDDEMSVLAVVRESKNFKREKSRQYQHQQGHSSESQRSESRSCYYCKKPGHLKANCRIRSRDMERSKQSTSRDISKNNNRDHGRVGFVCTLEDSDNSNLCAFSEGASNRQMPSEIMKLDVSESWFTDSGASQHITFRREWLQDFVESNCEESIFLGDNKACRIKGSGTIMIDRYINGKRFQGQLEDVLFIPDMKKNLISVGACTRKGFSVSFSGDIVQFIKDSRVKGVGTRQSNNIYRMFFKVARPCEVNIAVGSQLWHERLGHVNQKKLHEMVSKNIITGISLNERTTFPCDPCQTAKSHRLPFDKDRVHASCRVGEYFHSDVCGPMPEDSLGGARYFLTFKDEASGYLHVYFLRHKSDVVDKFRIFERSVNNKFGRTMRVLRSDNGREYCNHEMQKTLNKYGIRLETTAPYTPEKNGQAERVNRTVVEMVRAMMLKAKAPSFLWAEAVNTAAHIINRLSTRAKSITPFEAWWNKKPDVSHIKVFGTLAYSHIPKQFRKKFDPNAKRTWIVGYDGDSSNYRLYDPSSRKIVISRNVTFNEGIFIGTYGDEETLAIPMPIISSPEPDSGERLSCALDESMQRETDADLTTEISAGSSPVRSQSPEHSSRKRKVDEMYRSNISLRDRTLIKKPKRLGLVADVATSDVFEPSTYDEATSGPDAEKWQDAIRQELQSLEKNGTWTLVPRPKDRKVIDSRWVFRFQEEKAGKPRKYKARLRARGFRQQEGIDFQETFAPVMRYDATRMMLAIAAQFDLEIIQFDVATAFLHGELEEEVYMEPPLGINASENYVCKLQKALYGLKQASRCWNTTFRNYLCSHGFRCCDSESSVFVGKRQGALRLVMFLKYVVAQCLGAHRQARVSLSSTEAEYVATATATREIIWLRKILSDLGHPCKEPTILHVDNMSAIQLTKNPVFHKQTKHIETKYHFIREKFAEKTIDVIHVPSKMQLADILIKALPRPQYEELCDLIGMCSM
ncbi:hypothetical protein TKK_0002986 [Trichogramma kaykai]